MSVQLEPGTLLWRVHRRELEDGTRLESWRFNPITPPTVYDGGRFDPIEVAGPSHLYLGESDACAIAETFLRVLETQGPRARVLPQIMREGRSLAQLEVLEPRPLVSLVGGRALRQVGQDSWLTKCDPTEYPFTREWGRSIRAWCPWATGFVWRSRLDEDLYSYVLFRESPGRQLLAERATFPLDDDTGLARLKAILLAYNVTIS